MNNEVELSEAENYNLVIKNAIEKLNYSEPSKEEIRYAANALSMCLNLQIKDFKIKDIDLHDIEMARLKEKVKKLENKVLSLNHGIEKTRILLIQFRARCKKYKRILAKLGFIF